MQEEQASCDLKRAEAEERCCKVLIEKKQMGETLLVGLMAQIEEFRDMAVQANREKGVLQLEHDLQIKQVMVH